MNGRYLSGSDWLASIFSMKGSPMPTSLLQVKGIGPATAERLKAAGFTTAEQLAVATVRELTDIPGFGAFRAKQVLASARQVAEAPAPSVAKPKAAKVEKIKSAKKKAEKKKDKKGKSKKDKEKKGKEKKEKSKKTKTKKKTAAKKKRCYSF
jgi:hypothetical protein